MRLVLFIAILCGLVELVRYCAPQPAYKTELFRGEQQVCARTLKGSETVSYRCVPVESLGINRDELG